MQSYETAIIGGGNGSAIDRRAPRGNGTGELERGSAVSTAIVADPEFHSRRNLVDPAGE